MAKIIVMSDEKVLQELFLTRERTTIGRRPHNDIVIPSLAVSAEHAAIITINGDSFLEDLNSTNGTQVNGQPVKKHFLQNDDVVEIARYKIRYVAEPALPVAAASHQRQVPRTAPAAMLKILNGASADREIPLTKPLTTIGQPDLQVAVLLQRQDGYVLVHAEGKSQPLVNGLPLNSAEAPVGNGDVIQVAGIDMTLIMDEPNSVTQQQVGAKNC